MSITPSDGATDADPAAPIDIEFSHELDAGTISTDGIAVMDGEVPVSGTATCDGRHVLFTPHTKLSLLTRYSVVVRSTLRDVDSVPMQHDFTSAFTVRDGTWTRVIRPSANRSWLAGLTVDAEGQFILGLSDSMNSVQQYSAGAWGAPIPAACKGCFDFVLRGNGRGDALAVAIDETGRATARRLLDRTWQPESANIAGLTGYLPQALVTAAVAPNGEAHVLFVDDRVIRTTQATGAGIWSDVLSTPVTDTMYFRPALAFDSQGAGFAAWVAHDEKDDRSGVHFIRFESGRTTPVDSIPNSWDEHQSLGQVALAMTPTGDAAAVWGGPGGLHTSNYTAGAWSASTRINNSENAVLCAPPTIVSDGDDFVVAWGQPTNQVSTKCGVYSSRWHTGIWSAPERLGEASASNSNPPLLAADPHSNLLLVWHTEAHATSARFNGVTHGWTVAALDSAVPWNGAMAMAMASDGSAMAASEDDGPIFTALFE